jgi:hypothetical protein
LSSDKTTAIYQLARGLSALRLEAPTRVVEDLTVLVNAAIDEARQQGRVEMARYVNNFCARSPLCSRSFEP